MIEEPDERHEDSGIWRVAIRKPRPAIRPAPAQRMRRSACR